MTDTDTIMIFFLTFYAFIGWRNGIWKTLLGPFSLVFSTGLGYFYFMRTHKVLLSLMICLLGPFVMNFMLLAIVNMWQEGTDREVTLTWVGRLLGSVANFLWGSILAGLFLYLFVLVPPHVFGLENIQEDVTRSVSFGVLQAVCPTPVPRRIAEVYQDPERIAEIQESEEFQLLMQDDRVQSLANDEEIIAQIRNKDILGLLQNKKLAEILKDKELLMKFYDVHKVILEKGTAASPEPASGSPENKNSNP